MTITYFNNVEQGSDEWHSMRCGILTASEMKFIITPTLKTASNEKERQHLYELLGQRITGYVEPHYVSDDMLRGHEDEVRARIAYNEKVAEVSDCGFIINDDLGFKIGYSPDGLVGGDGLIECKSRRQKYQIETIVTNEVPSEYMLQLQTGLLVTKRSWIDFISYCGGLPMFVKRVYPIEDVQVAIEDAALKFEERLNAARKQYDDWKWCQKILIPTERSTEEEEITL